MFETAVSENNFGSESEAVEHVAVAVFAGNFD